MNRIPSSGRRLLAAAALAAVLAAPSARAMEPASKVLRVLKPSPGGVNRQAIPPVAPPPPPPERTGDAGAAALEHIALAPCLERWVELTENGPAVGPASFVVTLPDPLDTHFAREFDVFQLALLEAMAGAGFTLDRSCLPWDSEDQERVPGIHREVPGLLLFRQGRRAGRAVLVVGETPQNGVHAGSMERAIDRAERWSGGAVRVLGPTFSGSAPSLASALGAAHVEDALIVSGSATDSHLADFFPGQRVVALAATNEDLQSCVWNRLVPERLGLDTRWEPPAEPDAKPPPAELLCPPGSAADGADDDNARVALLVESSAYGSQFLASGFQVVPFPASISRLRAAHQEQERAAREAERTAGAPLRHLAIDLGRSAAGGWAPFDVQGTAVSQDLILAELLDHLARLKVEVVGIIATNILDKLFLAEAVRQAVPYARLVTFEGDVLLSHPDLAEVTAGMLVVSSHPLERPQPLLAAGGERRRSAGSRDRGAAGGLHLRFDLDAAEGIYDAARYLAADEEPPPRAVWAQMVGQGELFPLWRQQIARVAVRAEVDPAPAPGVTARSGVLPGPPGSGPSGPSPLPLAWVIVTTISTFLLGLVVFSGLVAVRRQGRILGLAPTDVFTVPLRPRRRSYRSDTGVHFLVYLATLVLGVPYLLIAAPSLQGVLGEAPARSSFLAGVPAALGETANYAVALIGTIVPLAALWLLVSLAHHTRCELAAARGPAAPRGWRRWAALTPLVLGTALVPLAVLADVVWISQVWGEGVATDAVLRRSLEISRGVSPLLPTALLGVVVAAWCLLSLHRRSVLAEVTGPAVPRPSPRQRGARPAGDRVGEVRRAVDPIHLGRRFFASSVVLVYLPLVWLAVAYGTFHLPVRSLEGLDYDLVLTGLFVLCLTLAVASGVALEQGWKALKAFLEWIEGLEGGSFGTRVAEAYAATRTSPSLAAARQREAWQRLREIDAASAPPAVAALLDRLGGVESAAAAWPVVAGWLTEGPGEDSGQPAVAASRDLFCWGIVRLVGAVWSQLRHLMGFVAAAVVLLLGAVTAYPLQPQRLLFIYLGLLAILGISVSVAVLLDADRVGILRDRSKAQEQGRRRALLGRLALYGGVPALSLLASRFPELRGLLFDWIQPLLKALG